MNDGMKKWLDSQSVGFKEKAAKCKTKEEFLALAGNEGIQLPDEILDGVAGGGDIYLYPWYWIPPLAY